MIRHGWAFLVLALCNVSAVADDSPLHLPSRSVKFPCRVAADKVKATRKVELHVSDDLGKTWACVKEVAPSEQTIAYDAPADGEYWFQIVIVDDKGNRLPADLSKETPAQKTIFDATLPVISITSIRRDNEEVTIEWNTVDKNLEKETTRVSIRPASASPWTAWQEVLLAQGIWNGVRFAPGVSGPIVVRVTAKDRAGNEGMVTKEIPAAAAPRPDRTYPVPPRVEVSAQRLEVAPMPRARGGNPTDSALQALERATAAKDKGNWGEALEHLNEAIRLDPTNAEAWSKRSAAWAMHREWDKLIADANEAIRLNPSSAKAYHHRARAWFEKREVDKSLTDINEAIRLDPDEANFYRERTNIWALKEDWDRVIADLDRVLDGHLKKPLEQSQIAYALYNRGYSWSKKGEWDKALADLDHALALEPNSPIFNRSRAEMWNARESVEKALADANETIRLHPDDESAFARRATIWYARGKKEQAVADFDRAIQIKPDKAEYWAWRAYTWNSRGESDKAIVDYTEAIRLNPKDPYSFQSRGHIWIKKSEWDKAIADFTEAVRLNPKDTYSLFWRAGAWYSKKDHERMTQDLEAVLAIDPGHREAKDYLAKVKAWNERTSSTLLNWAQPSANDDRGGLYGPSSPIGIQSRTHSTPKAFSALTPVRPEEIRDIYLLAMAESREGRWAKSLSDLDLVLQIESHHVLASIQRAWIHAACPDEKFREPKLAFADAKRACELTDWKSPGAMEALAASYAENGQFDDAIKWQDYVVRNYGDGDNRKETMERRLKLYRERKPVRIE